MDSVFLREDIRELRRSSTPPGSYPKMNLRELSSHLQLSQTTVSRALNGYPEVSELTRQRVLAAAHELNYQPSNSAQRLATGRTHVIGHYIPRSQESLFGPHFADVFAGVSDACARLGYESQFSVVDDDKQTAIYRKAAAGRRFDGMILHGPMVEEPRIDLLRELGMPFVVHGRTRRENGYQWLDVDHDKATRLATELLLDLGHTRIALLNGFEYFGYAARRRAGFEQAHALRELPITTRHLMQDHLTEDYGHDATRALLARTPAPTAIVASGLLVAFGALRALQESGMTLGQDISIVAYDDRIAWLPNGGEVPLFTTLRSSLRTAGTRLIELLDRRIDDPNGEPIGELWEPELVLGTSTGHLPAIP